MKKIIFVRHGQSVANADGILADAHSELTEKGIKQAHETAQQLKKLGIKTIVCSPMRRAQQTAEVIASELGIDIKNVQTIDELRERGLGELETKPKTHESEWYFTKDDDESGVESCADLMVRMKKALEIIKNLPSNDSILVVGHSCSGMYLLKVASGKANDNDFDPSHYLDNAAYKIIEL